MDSRLSLAAGRGRGLGLSVSGVGVVPAGGSVSGGVFASAPGEGGAGFGFFSGGFGAGFFSPRAFVVGWSSAGDLGAGASCVALGVGFFSEGVAF